MALMQLHIYSSVLGMQMPCWAFIPERLPDDGKPTKVFWFIHGGHGDHTLWTRWTGIENEAKTRQIAVIMPAAHNSSYTNMYHWHRYNEYIGSELPRIIRGMFPSLSHDRMDNWVGGFSNGGYGSFSIALSHPETFGWACPAGAGDKAEVNWDENPSEKKIVYGADTVMEESEYSLQWLTSQLIANKRPYPYLFHCCGEFDNWLDMNYSVRDFFKTFDSPQGNPFNYSFLEIKGEKHSARAMEMAYQAFFDHIGLPKIDPRKYRKPVSERSGHKKQG